MSFEITIDRSDNMAQLVKLQDYISRYQIDLARYPTQFVRLKKSQWERVKHQWETGEEIGKWEHIEEVEDIDEKSRFSFIKKIFLGRHKNEQENQEELDIESVDVDNELMDEEHEIEETTNLFFEPNIIYSPKSLEELKRMFMDQFFHFQIKWASSTLREKSYVDPRFLRDTLLRVFLQKLPDNYLVFYYPVLKLKKAPVELDVLIMTPTECLCIKVLEQENQAVYVGNGDRFWTKKVGKQEKKILNPFIDLKRMENILSQIFKQNGVSMPIRKVVLTRTGYFDYPGSAYGVQFVDKRKYPEWLYNLRRTTSPMKHMQIRAAQTILNTVETTSFNRNIWHAGQQSQKEHDQA